MSGVMTGFADSAFSIYLFCPSSHLFTAMIQAATASSWVNTVASVSVRFELGYRLHRTLNNSSSNKIEFFSLSTLVGVGWVGGWEDWKQAILNGDGGSSPGILDPVFSFYCLSLYILFWLKMTAGIPAILTALQAGRGKKDRKARKDFSHLS